MENIKFPALFVHSLLDYSSALVLNSENHSKFRKSVQIPKISSISIKVDINKPNWKFWFTGTIILAVSACLESFSNYAINFIYGWYSDRCNNLKLYQLVNHQKVCNPRWSLLVIHIQEKKPILVQLWIESVFPLIFLVRLKLILSSSVVITPKSSTCIGVQRHNRATVWNPPPHHMWWLC